MKKQGIKRAIAFLLFIIGVTALTMSGAAAYNSPFPLPEKAPFDGARKPAKIEYKLREGGTFLYNNNPERLEAEDIDSILLLEHDISGDVYFTSENYNDTGVGLLFGLQLRNNSGSDITVTVKNIGWLNARDWFGQQEWTDFFQTAFELEERKGEYFFQTMAQPVAFTPETYTIPDGEYIYVAGGSDYDSYNGITVRNTGDRWVHNGQLINTAVYFTVEGPETGVSVAYVCYNNREKPLTEDKQVGYVCMRGDTQYGLQYTGSAPYLCAEAAISWEINEFSTGKLPVTYDVPYYSDDNSAKIPYRRYQNLETNTVFDNVWKTHLNSNWEHDHVGTDMMPFHCETVDGQKVVIDIHGNDGTGYAANIGNWMVVYEETMSFKNSGNRAKNLKLFVENTGFLAVNLRNEDGSLIKSFYHTNADAPLFDIEVAPGEEKTIGVEYVNLADGYGSIKHYVKASNVKRETSEEVSKETTEAVSESEPTEKGGKGRTLATIGVILGAAIIAGAIGFFASRSKKSEKDAEK